MFDRLVWKEDRVLLEDIDFRMESGLGDDYLQLDKDYFILYKSPELVSDYSEFFSALSLKPQNVFELGLWDGGSSAFWFEVLQPKKHVGIDNSERGDSTYFKQWVERRGIRERVSTYWGVDQADKEALREIVAREFDGPLDVVIDDASHFDEPTRASFETLFPLLREGGVYIIEDWQWEHDESFINPGHPWVDEKGLTELVVGLLHATATQSKGLIDKLTVMAGFAAATRGWARIDDREGFALESYITRRPQRA